MTLHRSLVAGLTLALLTTAAGSASAATNVGQLFTPTKGCKNFTRLQVAAPSAPSYEVPFEGVITSWRFQNGAGPVKGLKFKVGRSGGGTVFTIIGETLGGAGKANTVTTKPARISVKPRDYIGVYAKAGPCQLVTTQTYDIFAQYAGDAPLGSTSKEWPYNNYAKIPVQASLERDADRDGWGDESQDGCPGVAGSASGCPTGT
jgi:hypothetical protein